jgi:ABC-2 type transport system permease protein
MRDQTPTRPTRRRQCLWIGFTTFVIRSYKDIVRYFILTIAPSAVMTALYFIIFGELIGRRMGAVGGVDYLHYVAPGLIMMPIITNSYSHAALSFVAAKIHRTLDEHLTSPLPSWMIVVSYVTGGMMRGILVGVTVGMVALLFTHTHIQHFFFMMGALFLTSLVCSLAGFINAVFAKDFDHATWVSSFVLTPLTYCGGVFYSLDLLPKWAQQLSLANPTVYMINLFRYGMLGVSDVSVGAAVLIMLIAAFGLFRTAAMLMKRGIGIKD